MSEGFTLPVKLGKFLSDYTIFSRTKLAQFMRANKVRVFIPHSALRKQISPPLLPSLLSPVSDPSHSSQVVSGVTLFVPTLEGMTSVNSTEVDSLCDATPIFEHDLVFLNGCLVKRTQLPKYYYAFHKPENYVTMRGEAWGKNVSLEEFFTSLPAGVEHVGRLDKMTTGLMLLTNDGDLNHAVLQKGNMAKEYHLLIWGGDIKLTDPRLQRLLEGVELTDGSARALEINILDVSLALGYCPHQFQKLESTEGMSKGQQKKLAKLLRNKRSNPSEHKEVELMTLDEIREKWSLISVTIAEGRNRIVRRMAKAVGLMLVHLHRASFGPLRLEVPCGKKMKSELSKEEMIVQLPAGAFCLLSEHQKAAFAKILELAEVDTVKALRGWVLRARTFRKQNQPNERLEQFFIDNQIDMSAFEDAKWEKEELEDDEDPEDV